MDNWSKLNYDKMDDKFYADFLQILKDSVYENEESSFKMQSRKQIRTLDDPWEPSMRYHL
jgi:hypothetical protein